MKVGFGGGQSKKQKKRANKKAAAAKKDGKADGDDVMKDAKAPNCTPEPAPGPGGPAAAAVDGALRALSAPSAKDKQRSRMELKRALKVQVASFKNKRNKLTKLAGNKKQQQQQQAAGAPAADGDAAMAE